MSDYTELVKALRERARREEEWYEHGGDLISDAAAAIEALQAELKRLEPKRGEWTWIQRANGGQYKGCSVCHAPMPTDSMLDYLDDEDCKFCYSCGAKMEVQDAEM